MAQFPIVLGERLRATRINSCGRPIPGKCGYLVTDGFVKISLSATMKDAEELEQTNASGRVCVTARTQPTRKYHTVEAEFCNVNTELISLFSGWEQVLDYAGLPIGFQDQPDVETDFGVAIEVWTGGRAEDDCPDPEDDTIFASTGSGRKYGYFLFGGTEWKVGDIEIGAQVSTLKLSGITIAIPHWGKGPYNVQQLDAAGTPGRLLERMNKKSHKRVFRTAVAPPAPTKGCCELAISEIFTGSTYYYGGPGGAPAADVAPDQPDCDLAESNGAEELEESVP